MNHFSSPAASGLNGKSCNFNLNRILPWLPVFCSFFVIGSNLFSSDLAALETGFQNPPRSARPAIFWFWLNGNINSNGITADLEAMNRVGIGSVIIMEVDQGTPKGPIAFGSS